MKTEVFTEGNRAILNLHGRFDFDAHQAFRHSIDPVLSAQEITDIQLNLEHLEYICSSALGMLLMVRDKVRTHGKRRVRIHNAHGRVKHVLDVSNLAPMFA